MVCYGGGGASREALMSGPGLGLAVVRVDDAQPAGGAVVALVRAFPAGRRVGVGDQPMQVAAEAEVAEGWLSIPVWEDKNNPADPDAVWFAKSEEGGMEYVPVAAVDWCSR